MSYEDDDENEVLWDNLNRQEREIHSLRSALDAAQDEIEKLISEKETLRERLEWEQPEPDGDVIGVTDYTDPQNLYDDDSVTWGRVHKAGEGGPHSEWKGYKDGNKVYLDWPELVRRWGPITPTMRSLKIHDPGIHQPFDDDGVDYCGWRGDDGIHGGCGELWPCSSRGGAS